jgi:hypothetical protein
MAAERPPRFVHVGQHPVACSFCSYGQFYDRPVLLNTPGLAFFDLDWANKQAVGLICAQCGHIMHFMGGNVTFTDAPAT